MPAGLRGGILGACAGLVLGLAGLGAAPNAEQRLGELFADLDAAKQAGEPERLRAIYAEIARLQPEDAEIQRGLGLACYLGGRFEEAAAALKRAVELRAGLAGARLYLGISYYRLNRFPEALRELEQSPEILADEPVARYWQGATLRALGRLPGAIAALEAAQARAPANQEVLQLLARSYSEHAAELLKRLLAEAPTSAPARLLRAEELAMDGVHTAALRELEAALKGQPGLIGLHLLKGETLWAQGEYEAGAAAFRLELQNDPLSLEALVRLGAFALDNGDPLEATRHLGLARRLRPADEQVRELFARALQASDGKADPIGPPPEQPPPTDPSVAGARTAYGQGRLDLAVTVLERLLATNQGTKEARRLLARCHLAAGELLRAADQLRTTLARARADPADLYLLGRTSERLASRAAESLFELDSSSVASLLLRGESFERGPRHEFAKALAEFRKAEELAPADPSVQHAIARVLFKLKRFDEAVPHLERTLESNRGHGMASYLLGKIKLAHGDRRGAIGALRQAVATRPNLEDAWRDLARALVLDGRYAEGIAIYERLARLAPGDVSLHASLAQAYRRAGRLEEAKAQADEIRRLGTKARSQQQR